MSPEPVQMTLTTEALQAMARGFLGLPLDPYAAPWPATLSPPRGRRRRIPPHDHPDPDDHGAEQQD